MRSGAVSDDEGRRASPEVGWGYAGRRIVSTVGSRARASTGTGTLHGRATGLLQRAAEQTMQSIAALAKQWADVRTGEQPTVAMGKDLGPGVRAEHRRLAGKALGPLHLRPVRRWTASANSHGSSVPGEHADFARLSPVVRRCSNVARPRPSSAMT